MKALGPIRQEDQHMQSPRGGNYDFSISKEWANGQCGCPSSLHCVGCTFVDCIFGEGDQDEELK